MRLFILMLMGVSTMAFAHPGHDDMFHSALLAGMLHPLTGLDHLIMGLGLGMLMTRGFKQARYAGLALLLLALLAGFVMGYQHVLSSHVAEYGIVASLIVLAVALWQRANSVYLQMLALLGVFHGMAHGYELALNVNPVWFVLGMTISLATLYLVGTWVSRWVMQQAKFSDRTVAVLAAAVALLDIA